MKKLISFLLAVCLLTLSGCGFLSKGGKQGAKDGPKVSINGVTVTLDKTDKYLERFSYLTSSDLKVKESKSRMIYLPLEDENSEIMRDSKFYLYISSASYQYYDSTVETLKTDTDTYRDLKLEKKEINGTEWTYADYTKHVVIEQDNDAFDWYYHEYLTEKEFDGATDLVKFTFVHAENIAEYEEAVMDSVTFIK